MLETQFEDIVSGNTERCLNEFLESQHSFEEYVQVKIFLYLTRQLLHIY